MIRPTQAEQDAAELRYDYTNQAWIQNGKYAACNHPAAMDCRCFGKLHAGRGRAPRGARLAAMRAKQAERRRAPQRAQRITTPGAIESLARSRAGSAAAGPVGNGHDARTKQKPLTQKAKHRMTEINWHEANERARTRQAQTLAAKVAGQNKVNAAANEYEKQLIEAFRPFIGTKILTHNGIAARVKPHIPKAPQGVRCWRAGGTVFGFYYEMDVREPVGEYGYCYCKATAYVGELDGYDLKKVNEPQSPRRTDWTVEEVREKRQALREARDAMNTAQSALAYFGEYDQ